jgi:hypothetical protein
MLADWDEEAAVAAITAATDLSSLLGRPAPGASQP